MITAETPWDTDQSDPDPEFVKAVVANMDAVGLPLLGHITLSRSRDFEVRMERDRNPSTVVAGPPDRGVIAAAQAIHPAGLACFPGTRPAFSATRVYDESRLGSERFDAENPPGPLGPDLAR